MSLWLVLVPPFSVIEVFVLPRLATEAPTVAEAFLGVFTKTAGPIEFSALAAQPALGQGMVQLRQSSAK